MTRNDVMTAIEKRLMSAEMTTMNLWLMAAAVLS